MHVPYDSITFDHRNENGVIQEYKSISLDAYICNKPNKFDYNYRFLIKLLNHLYCIIISIHIKLIRKNYKK